MASGNKKLYGLDHLRAFAIFYVFLFHYFILSGGQPDWLPGLAKFGWTGVDLFFVLSGFLIASPLFAQMQQGMRISFSQFFIKRFFRIVPAFLVTVGLYFLFPVFREKESLPPLWKFLTFTHNIGLNLQDQGTFSHAWSLCVEEHFYLLLPLILIGLQRTRTVKHSYWLLLLLFVFGIFIRIYSFNVLYWPNSAAKNSWMYWYEFVYYPTYCRLDGLLVGVGIAGIYQFFPSVWSKVSLHGNLFICSGLAILSGAYGLCQDPQTFYASVWGFLLVAVGYGFLVTGAVSQDSFLFRYRSKITSKIAALSYAIYLTHKGVIHLTQLWLRNFDLDSNVLLLICILSCFVAGFLLNLAIEKPFMNLRTKLLADR